MSNGEPHSAPNSHPLPPPPSITFPQNEAQIRAAVLEFHSKECCFDKRPIKYMTISTITPMTAYRYIVEAVIERRDISSKSIPYRGQVLPSPKPCPSDKWSIPIPATPPTTDLPATSVLELKETAAKIPCPTCQGTGHTLCHDCRGLGSVICGNCTGSGKARLGKHSRPCRKCGGGGRISCRVCHKSGWKSCALCEGQRSLLLWYILTLDWEEEVKIFTTTIGDLSPRLLEECEWFQKEEVSQTSTPEHLCPLEFPPDPEVTTMAGSYVQELMGKRDARVLSLKQTVKGVPVIRADFKWGKVFDSFYVYGVDKQVDFPGDYPATSSCSCCHNPSCIIT